MTHTLRVGTVAFSNSYPLDYYLPEFLHDVTPEPLLRLPPSELGRRMADGELDIALLSSIELLRHPEYTRIPGMGICSRGPVSSVLLFSKKDPADIRTLALDQNSLTSVVLVRILLKEMWNCEPQTVPFTPPLENGLHDADAALTIGDSSFVDHPEGVHVFDLGQWWHEHTGLPFVYAAWLVKPSGFDLTTISPVFERAMQKGLANRDALAAVCAETGLRSAAFYHEYMTRYIRYDVGHDEEQGLACFLEKARPFLPEVI